MNMEFHLGDFLPGSIVFVQHGSALTAYTVHELNNRENVTRIGSIGISREFLKVVVESIISSETQTARLNGIDMVVEFSDGAMTIGDTTGRALGHLSGDVLRNVAAFMSYWVDHDGVTVPTDLQINYDSPVRDAQGRSWTVNVAY